MAEYVAEKAGGVGRLRAGLLGLLLKLRELLLGLIEGDVLHQYGLREDVDGVGV
jgi:hypothetical protein